jgi:serine/threonine-protein kinase
MASSGKKKDDGDPRGFMATIRAPAQRGDATADTDAPAPNSNATLPPTLASEDASAAAPIRAEDAPLVAQKYRLGRVIHRGVGSHVYEANQTTLARTVAVRLLTSKAEERDEKRIIAEARLLAQLAHPNVLEVYELGMHEGRPFVAMELLVGESLRDKMDREGKLSLVDAATIGAGILNGLRAAHEASVVHRGLTPRHVFLADKRGKTTVKIADLGVRADADPRLDLYAAGVVLYEMLTGQLPFPKVDIERELNDQFTRMPKGPSEINELLGLDTDAFAMRALAESRDERFQSAVEMLDAWCSIAAFQPYMNA